MITPVSRVNRGVLLLLLMSWSAWAGEFSDWKAPVGAQIDPTGGRHGTASLLLSQAKETTTDSWVSPPEKVTGKYVRASAWMKAADLYYLDFGFFAYGALEFLDGGGKVLKEEAFILSREIVLNDALLYQRMETYARHLTFDWRYGEKTVPVAQGAVQVRAKFGLSQRTTGQAWLDDVVVTFADTPEPAQAAANVRAALPEIEVRLRTPQFSRNEDPLGHIFFPNEDAVFCARLPKSQAASKNAMLIATLLDTENFVIWHAQSEFKGAGDWTNVVLPKEVAANYVGRLLTMRFEAQAQGTPIAQAEIGFGYVNEYRRDEVADGPERRYIGNLRSNWNAARQSRFWMQRGESFTTCSLHGKNIWTDGSRPPDMDNLPPFYLRPDIFNKKFNYSVVAIVTPSEPHLIPEFAHLGHHALATPESISTFMHAAVKRFPHVKYWKAFSELYRRDVPGYRQAFANCQKAFYEAVRAENPNAVVILDNSSVRDDGKALFDLGLFNYCDAIDPHLYGQVEETMFGFFRKEKELLESWGVHKRWISIEADPVAGAGAYGIEQRWVSEEIPKVMGSFFALGGEKLCLLGSGAITDPTDPFYADAHGGPAFMPTINYFSYRRFVDQVGLKPAAGSFVLGDTKVRYQRFDDKDRSVVVMWSPTGVNTVEVQSKSDLRLVDNVRTDASLRPANGITRITVGFQPVYVSGAPDMKLSLAAAPSRVEASGGGLVAGKMSTVTLYLPEGAAQTASILLPPGVQAAAPEVPVRSGKAEFEITVPDDHQGQVATLTFVYGQSSAGDSALVQRFELIRPIRAEIWPDAAMRGDQPRYEVRVTNENPIPARGQVVARAPITDAARPPEVSLPFEVRAKSTTSLMFKFPKAEVPQLVDDQYAWRAVAMIHPEDSESFAIRDSVSLNRLPKVKPGLRIDGDLSDWPAATETSAYSIGNPQQFVGATATSKPGDVHGQLQVSWDRATLYFAVRVRGQDAAKSQGIRILMTNAQDKRMAKYEPKDQRRDYRIVPKHDGFALEAVSQSKDGHGVIYRARRVADGIDYEVAIPFWEAADVVQIDPDRWVRLSLAVYDTDGKSFWQWFGGAKDPKDYPAYGDFQLAAFGADEWGQRYGCPFAGNGRKRGGYVGLAVLDNGDRVRVKVTAAEKSLAEVLSHAGKVVRQFELPVGQLIHTVDVDNRGRLVVGDRVAGVNFYSTTTGEMIPVGPTRGFYPKRHIVEYRSQGYAQDAEGNYFVTIVCKRRDGWKQPIPVQVATNLTKISGLTMFNPDGNEIPSFGTDIVVLNANAPLHVFGNMGERAGAFLYAESVAIDSAANMWVTDTDAHTIQVFQKRAPGTYDESPLVYQKMPAEMQACWLRSLPGGKMLAWNEKQMRVASLADGAIRFSDPRPFASTVTDLKVFDKQAITLDASGAIQELDLPQ